MLKLLILATAVVVAAADDSYVVLSPKSFRAGVPLNISVNILKSTDPVDVTATLVNAGTTTTIASAHGQFSAGHPGTLQLNVPDDARSGSYKLHVTGTGSSVNFVNETSLQFESKSISVFIQTDKAMYKPGQTVNFRTFAVFPNLTVYSGLYDVEIYDPNTNKIKQWKGLQDASGVITKFMLMDTQPVLGDWRIKVSAHGRTEEKTFTVAHYVLPKFEVTVELPSFILTSDTSLTGTIKATYTYGKPVQGTADVKISLANWYKPYNYQGTPPEITQLGLIMDGEAKFTVPLAHISQIQRYLNGHHLTVKANVTESLNSITLSGSSEVKYYDHAVKLEFLKSNPNTFKPGLPYTAYLKVAQQDDTPLMGLRKDLSITSRSTYEDVVTSTPYPWYTPPQHTYELPKQTAVIPDNGIVPIQVDIPENSTHMEITADYAGITARLSLSKSYSPSNTYIQLFLKSTNLRAGSDAMFEIKSTEAVTSSVYQVMSRGSIVAAGSFSGQTFSVPVTSEMAPNARIIIYYARTDGEVVTDSISFDVEGVFQNQVSIDFDKTKAQPGESVNVVVTADPQSLVNLLAVDQSVLLLKSGNDVTASEVIDELKTYDTITPVHNQFFGGGDIMPMAVGRKKRMIWWPYPVYYGGSDASAIFNNAGVKVMTDAMVYHHVEQPIYPIFRPDFAFGGAVPGAIAPVMAPNMGMATGSSSGPAPVKSVERVRSVFPETWLWTNSTIGPYVWSGTCIWWSY